MNRENDSLTSLQYKEGKRMKLFCIYIGHDDVCADHYSVKRRCIGPYNSRKAAVIDLKEKGWKYSAGVYVLPNSEEVECIYAEIKPLESNLINVNEVVIFGRNNHG